MGKLSTLDARLKFEEIRDNNNLSLCKKYAILRDLEKECEDRNASEGIENWIIITDKRLNDFKLTLEGERPLYVVEDESTDDIVYFTTWEETTAYLDKREDRSKEYRVRKIDQDEWAEDEQIKHDALVSSIEGHYEVTMFLDDLTSEEIKLIGSMDENFDRSNFDTRFTLKYIPSKAVREYLASAYPEYIPSIEEAAAILTAGIRTRTHEETKELFERLLANKVGKSNNPVFFQIECYLSQVEKEYSKFFESTSDEYYEFDVGHWSDSVVFKSFDKLIEYAKIVFEDELREHEIKVYKQTFDDAECPDARSSLTFRIENDELILVFGNVNLLRFDYNTIPHPFKDGDILIRGSNPFIYQEKSPYRDVEQMLSVSGYGHITEFLAGVNPLQCEYVEKLEGMDMILGPISEYIKGNMSLPEFLRRYDALHQTELAKGIFRHIVNTEDDSITTSLY